MTLHEAMTIAINELGGGKQRMEDVANYINEHKLYTRGDGAPVPTNQISARVHQYPNLFSRGGGYVWHN
ncbi:MAG: hypothetical protein IJ183_06800 [Prevotella sp.]|nr:hypothetical protein [Prevotella sp.]MBR1840427.1 hypothetical protein [Prevotella sp.]